MRHEQLSNLNQQWQQDDQQWAAELDHWQHVTQQWGALLYLLDKNLPEHTQTLDRHRQNIHQHSQSLLDFRCGLDEQCMATCPDHMSIEQLEQKYMDLASMHQKMHEMHQALSAEFQSKKQTIKELAERLLNLLAED